ncbi:cellular morphogenesis protein [Grosmannia clavigera kw1407]|uniref:Cellular morphogenesis protein n=1 Tax=Grosmannia clavigera (strain kw1407 / UAMH 11150) TaxID=655863 RepID=F0XR46_GROCL|nr:cellular morphogenesis protein [Grosmannia clavigera kw1407]EFW99786.1 cellular morphogenesis protein [Grosmannia clavigera kw1407]
MRIPLRRRKDAVASASSMRQPVFSFASAATSFLALASMAPAPAQALNFTAAQSPNVDLSSLGRIGIGGDFAGISMFQFEEQTQSTVSTNGSEGLMARLPNGALTTILHTDASIMAMCSFVLKDGTNAGVVLGGNFTSIGSQEATAMVLFNPNTTEVTAIPGLSGQVNAVLCDEELNTVFVGGNFVENSSTNAITYVHGSGWTALPFAGFNGPVTSIAKAFNGHIIFGGSFTGLGNVSTPSEADEQIINISTANLTASGSTDTTGFSDPANIVCKTNGTDGAGNTWLLADDTAGFWEADFGFGFHPTKLRLWNTHQDGRGTETWRFTALPLNGIMNFTYIDPDTGANYTCTSECPLSHSKNVTYQDFYFVNYVGMDSFRIDISAWYGSGGGLDGIELFENEIFSYAIDDFNEPNCTASSAVDVSSATSTGPWTESPSFQSSSRYLTASLSSPIDSSSASVVFSPNIRQSGNYTVNMYTPGCLQDGSCGTRGQVNVTVTMSKGVTSSVRLYQTNNYDKFDPVYYGAVDAATESFRPTVTLTPLDGQSLSEMTIVAQRVGFTLNNSTGGLNGLFEYDPSQSSFDTSTFSSSAFDTLGSAFSSGSAVMALATSGEVTYVAGNFTSTNASNIVSVSSNGSSVESLDDGLNGGVLSMVLNGTKLFTGGIFNSSKSGSATDLNNVAVFDTTTNVWSALGAGVNGPVMKVVPMTMNITGSSADVVFAFTGGFDTLLAFGSNSAVTVDGFGVWVPSQGNWLQNLDQTVESINGVLLSSLLNVPGADALYGGSLSYAQVGSTDVATLTNSGIGSFGAHVLPSSASSSSAVLKRDTLSSSSVAGVLTGVFDTSGSRNKTILGGHFSAKSTNGTTIENLLIIDHNKNGSVSGLGSGISNSSTFAALAVTGSTLFAGGNVTGTVNSASVTGLVSYNLATDSFTMQPPSLSGGNGTVMAIKVRPGTTDVYVGGSFALAGSLGCPAVCYYSTSSNQWNRPGSNLVSGTVNSMVWTSNSELAAGGRFSVDSIGTVFLGQYDASKSVWSSFPGSSVIPGPVDVLVLGSSDGSELWVAGTASSNSSVYLLKYDGKDWVDALGASGQTLSSGTNIRSLQVFSASPKHDSTSVLSSDQVLVLAGSIVLPGYGTVSAAIFDGKTFKPYMLTMSSGNRASSIASIFVENNNFFTAKSRKHLPLVGVVLIGLAISLGLMLIIVAAGLLLDRLRKKQQGYIPAPSMADTGANRAWIPPKDLLDSLGRPPHEAPQPWGHEKGPLPSSHLTRLDNVVATQGKQKRLGLVGLWKEVFDWYPAEYPAAERRCMIISRYPSSYMSLWLKAEKYSVPQINKLPTGISGIFIVSSFVAWYFFGVAGFASLILYSAVNTIVKNDSEERALIMGSMMTFGYSFNIWVPLLLFPTAGEYGAPRWKKGWPVTIALCFFFCLGFTTATVLFRRRERLVVGATVELKV